MMSFRFCLGRLMVAVVALAAGCGSYGGLKSTIEALEPEAAQVIGRCQEYGAYVVDTPAYGCAYFVPGSRRAVSISLTESLERNGFDVVCEEDSLSGTIDVRARRSSIFISANVSRLGSLITMAGDEPLNIHRNARFVRSPYREAPARHVIVKLVAHEEDRGLGGGTRACRAYVGILRG